MKLWQALLGRQITRSQEITRYSVDQYANDIALAFAGNRYLLSSGSTGGKTEDIETSFTGYINSIYKSNGVVFAIILARMLLFTEGRFCWFDVGDNGENGRPAGRKGLEALELPWPNGGTGELLARMEQDVSLAGNFFAVRETERLRRLRPDWVTIVLTAPPGEAVEADVAGYWYHPGRSYSNAGEPAPGDDVYLPGEICHWSPIPDPDAQYRGMSWLTPVVREVMADKAAMAHKLAFFENGATLGLIISAKESLTNQQFKEWKDNFAGLHAGTSSAYKPLFLASPVDTTVTTADMQQLDFKVTMGAGETRLCAAGGVPPIIVGLSEGLASATYSNYSMARRKFGDHWGHPQWKSASTALSTVVDTPAPDLRLGVNTKGIAFLREDAKDLAEILQIRAATISSLISAGFEPDSTTLAVDAEDLTLLKHTGLVSVQLLPPGAQDSDGDGSADAAADPEADDEYTAALEEFRARRPGPGEIERGVPHPGQRYRHGWIPVAGMGILGKSYTLAELESTYGAAVDNDEFAPGAIVELASNGDIHIDIGSEAEDRWHVFGDMSQGDDFSPKLIDALDWATDHRMDTPGHRPPDSVNGLADWQDVDGVIVGYAPDGTVRIGWPHSDTEVNVMDLTRDEAMALIRALTTLLETDLPDEDEDEEE